MSSENTYSRTPGAHDARQIRDALKRDLPRDTFQAQTWRVIWFLPLSAIMIGGISSIILLDLAWYYDLAIGLIVGHSMVCQAFLAHEVLHGALGMSKGWQDFFGWLGFGPFTVPPLFWRRWHNLAHHGNTNMGDKDPDNFGTMARYEKHPGLARFTKLAPGSGTWYSYVFLLYSFIFHAHLVLWMQTRRREEFKGFARKRAIVQSLVAIGGWVVIAVLSGSDFVFSVLVPLAVGNFVAQGYILTNHFLRPQTETNHPVDNSMSVRKPRWLDPLHFRFSHHVEHHLFPKMASNKAPRVRAWLEEKMPERYVAPPHWKAVKMLYQTPRVYQTASILVDPTKPERKVDLQALQSELRG